MLLTVSIISIQIENSVQTHNSLYVGRNAFWE